MSPTVSLIIPVYNTGSYLPETMASAFAQTWPALEIVVVDDGSTDPLTLELLHELSADPRVLLIRQDNQGPAAALNTGIRASNAEWFMPLGSDDLIGPTYVQKSAEVMGRRPEVSIVYCRAEMFGAVAGPWGLPDFDWSTFLVHNLIFISALFRRSDWESVGGFDESMREGREDHDFVMKVLGHGGVPHRLEEVLFHYRIRPDSVNAQVGDSREKLIRAHASIFRNNLDTYQEHAEDLFTFIFRQHDEIMDLRHRYAALERLRTGHPRTVEAAKSVRNLARGAASSLRSARSALGSVRTRP